MPKISIDFKIGESCTCLYNGVAYDAKIQDVKEPDSENPKYVIHFKGWNTRYDEILPVKDSVDRLFRGPAAEYVEEYGGVLPEKKSTSQKATNQKTTAQDDVSSREDTPSAPPTISRAKSVKRPVIPSVVLTEKDMTVELPKPLKKMLIDDYDLVNRHFHTKVPATYTIDRIIADYIKTIPITNEEMKGLDDLYIEFEKTEAKVSNIALICSAKGLNDYFNVILGYQLLYKFERNQYNDIVQAEAAQKGLQRGNIATLPEHGFRASAHYGIIHLLRMISKLPTLLKLTEWNDHLINRIMIGVHDFVVFLNKNNRQYYHGADEYVAASSEYYRRAQTLDDDSTV